MILGGATEPLQAPVLVGVSFSSFSLQQDGLAAFNIDVGGGEVVQALVVAPVIAMLDEGLEGTTASR